jgi:hypothetical protein
LDKTFSEFTIAVMAIPFDYDPERDGESVIPIYLNDKDENGETILLRMDRSRCSHSGEAESPVEESSRRRLRVSEVTDLAIHQLWREYREGLGCHPSFRRYRTAKRAAHILKIPADASISP